MYIHVLYRYRRNRNAKFYNSDEQGRKASITSQTALTGTVLENSKTDTVFPQSPSEPRNETMLQANQPAVLSNEQTNFNITQMRGSNTTNNVTTV